MSKLVILSVIAALSGAAGYTIGEQGGPSTASPPAAQALAPSDAQTGGVPYNGNGGVPLEQLTQGTGTICETPRGECRVPQQPINSPCACSGTPGRIVR